MVGWGPIRGNSRGGQRVVMALRAIKTRGIPSMHIGYRSYTISAVNPQSSDFCMPEILSHIEGKAVPLAEIKKICKKRSAI